LEVALQLLGIGWLPYKRMLAAALLPLLHSMLLFLGPLFVGCQDYQYALGAKSAAHPPYVDVNQWRIKLRNYVVASGQ
jgi:hypothetical protein